MKFQTTITVVAVVLGLSTCIQGKPWDPTPKPDQGWLNRHNAMVENSRVNGSNIEIVMVGSSVMEFWTTTAAELWNSKYVPLKAVNYGIAGDLIENCLWRVTNGILDNMNPKLLVLYCGSNNVPLSNTPDEIVQGITVTLDEIGRRLPETNVLYVAINPRGDASPVEEIWSRISNVNQQVHMLDDGVDTFVFDMFDSLTESWGHIRQDLYTSDKLHLNFDGYKQWDALWNETFFNLLNN